GLSLRVALRDAALGSVLAVLVLLAVPTQALGAGIPRRFLGRARVRGGGQDEGCQQGVHQIRIGRITAGDRAPAPGSPAGLSTPGESSSQSSTFICSASTTWSTSIR